MSGLKAWIRAAWVPTLVTMLLIYGAGLHYLVLGLPGVGYSKHIELIPVGWRDFSRQVAVTAAQIRAETGADPLIVGMDRYAIASELAFYAAERTTAELGDLERTFVRRNRAHVRTMDAARAAGGPQLCC